MNKKGDFNIQGMLIGALSFGLFMTIFLTMITSFGSNYDLGDFNSADLEKYEIMPNVSAEITEAYGDIEQVTVDRNLFDVFAGIYNRILGPFKTIYRSFRLIRLSADMIVSDLELMKAIGDFINAVLVTLVIIGIVMIKFYMGRNK